MRGSGTALYLGKTVKRTLGNSKPWPLVGGCAQNIQCAVRAARVEHERLRAKRHDALEEASNAAGVIVLLVLHDRAEADGGQQAMRSIHDIGIARQLSKLLH